MKLDEKSISVRVIGEMIYNIQLSNLAVVDVLEKNKKQDHHHIGCTLDLDAGGEEQKFFLLVTFNFQERTQQCAIRLGKALELGVHQSHHVEGWILDRTFHEDKLLRIYKNYVFLFCGNRDSTRSW